MSTSTESWHEADEHDVPDEEHVRSVIVDARSIALDAAMAELFAIDGPALLCVEQDAGLL